MDKKTEKPEKIITIKVTALESHMIQIIRTISYGDIIVKKFAGKPIRVEPKATFLLNEAEGEKLKIESI